MSPTLLSKRLQQLVRAGLVTRTEDGSDVAYVLTPAGRELKPVVEAIGAWGMRWIGDLGEADLDPQLLLWDLHRNVDRDQLPPGRTVIAFRFPDLPAKRRSWWLVMTPEAIDVCDFDPGYEVAGGVTGAAAGPGAGLAGRPRVAAGAAVRDGLGRRTGGGPAADPGLVRALAVRRGAPRGAGRDPLSRPPTGRVP